MLRITEITALTGAVTPRMTSPRSASTTNLAAQNKRIDGKDIDIDDNDDQDIPEEYKNPSSSSHPQQQQQQSQQIIRRRSSIFGNLLSARRQQQAKQPVTTFTFQELVELGVLQEQDLQRINSEGRGNMVKFAYTEPGRVSMEIKPRVPPPAVVSKRRQSISQFMSKSARRLSIRFSRRFTQHEEDAVTCSTSPDAPSKSSGRIPPLPIDKDSMSLDELSHEATNCQIFELDELLDSLFDGADHGGPLSVTHTWHNLTVNTEPLLRLCAKMFFIKPSTHQQQQASQTPMT